MTASTSSLPSSSSLSADAPLYPRRHSPRYDVTRDVEQVSDLPASRVNAAITRMLNGVRLSSALWSEAGRRRSEVGGGVGGGSGSRPFQEHSQTTNMYGRSGSSDYYYTSPRSRLLQRYSDRAYDGVHQPRRAVSLWQKAEQTKQRLKECLVDEVADNLRQELGLLHLGVAAGRSASGGLASFNRAINQEEKVRRKSVEYGGKDYTDSNRYGLNADEYDHRKVVSGEVGGESTKGALTTSESVDIGKAEEEEGWRRRAHPRERPRQGEVSAGGGGSVTSGKHTLQDTDNHHHQHTSPLYILHDEVNPTEATINNNSTKQRRARARSMPTAGLSETGGLSGHTPYTHLATTGPPGHATMEYNTGSVGDPSTQFLPGSSGRDTSHHRSSSGHPSSFSRPRIPAPTTSHASGGIHNSPVIRGLPQSPSQTTMMIRDKRIPPMPSSTPPPLPKHLQDDLYADSRENSTQEEDEIPLDPQAQENKAVEELGVVPDGVNKNHLPLLRAKKVFEKELAVRLEKKMEEEDQLLGDLRLCMERPTLREKVETTMKVVHDVIKTKVTKDKNGNRIYSVVLDLGKFHRKVKHEVRDFVVEIEGSTFGPPETALSKVISIEFPESVVMEQLVLRQLGPSIEMEVPFKPNPLMNDLIDLVSKIDEDKEKQSRRNGVKSGGSLSSDQNSMSSGEQEEEQPPELPISPPPPMVVKKPRPMRRRRRSTLGSTSSESITSVLGKTEKSQAKNNTESGDHNQEQGRNGEIKQSDRDQGKVNITNGETGTEKLDLEPVPVSEDDKQKKTNLSKSKPSGKVTKTIEVNQTSSIFAPDECTQTKLEFDDSEFLTIRHVAVQDDKSETDSGIAMDKKPVNNMEPVSLSVDDYTSSLLKHESESNTSYQSNEEVETVHSELIHNSFSPDPRDIVLLQNEPKPEQELVHDRDINVIQEKEIHCNLSLEPQEIVQLQIEPEIEQEKDDFLIQEKEILSNLSLETQELVLLQNEPNIDLEMVHDKDIDLIQEKDKSSREAVHENQPCEYNIKVEPCLDVDDTEGMVQTSMSKVELNLSPKTSGPTKKDLDKISLDEAQNELNGSREIHVISGSEPNQKKPHENNLSHDLESNGGIMAQNMHMESSVGGVDIKVAGNKWNEKTVDSLETHGATSDTVVNLTEAVASQWKTEKEAPENEAETEMTQNESGVATLAVTPLRNSVDLGTQPRKLFTTSSRSREIEKDESDSLRRPAAMETRHETTEFYVRPKRRERQNADHNASLGGVEKTVKGSAETSAKVEEYVRPKRRTSGKVELEHLRKNQEQNDEVSLSPQRRRRDRKELVIKKAQSLSGKVPSLAPKTESSIDSKFSRLRSDLFRKDSSKNVTEIEKNSQTDSSISKVHQKEAGTTSELTNEPKQQKHDVVLRRKPVGTPESKSRFLRSKPDNVDLVELRRKRYSLDPGKLHRKFDSDFDLSESKKRSGSRQRSAEDSLMRYGSTEREEKVKRAEVDDKSTSRSKRLSLDSKISPSGRLSNDSSWMTGRSSHKVTSPSSPDNERVNKLRQMFENIGQGETSQKKNVSDRRSFDRPGHTPPQRGLHRKFKSEFTLNL